MDRITIIIIITTTTTTVLANLEPRTSVA